MSLPTTPAQPLRFVAPGPGAAAVHIPMVAVTSETECAICGATERVAPEAIPNATDVADDANITLPLCGTCARAQLRALGRGWALAVALALLPGAATVYLCLQVPLGLWATLASTLVFLSIGFATATLVTGRLRQQAVPILKISAQTLQVPTDASNASTAEAPAKLHRQIPGGFVIGAILVAVGSPFIWNGAMPALVLDNPTGETCVVEIGDESFTLLPASKPVEGNRLHASHHEVVVRCETAPPVQTAIAGEFGQPVLVSTDPRACYTSQHDAEAQSIGVVFSTTTTTRGTVQYPLTTPLGRGVCGRQTFRP